ncbi:ubiquitin-related domain-containing protein [Fennellomyces sp. T-0311]|nr:ubiquitin-related domain-containing protein [Fennellomyces sp. T-0311]
MAPETISVLISSFPGLTLSVPYDKNEPLHFLRDRISNCLYGTAACVDPEIASLHLDGKPISDYDKTMDHYELFGDMLTYKNAKVQGTPKLKMITSMQPSKLPSTVTVHVLTAIGQNITTNVPVDATVEELKQSISEGLNKDISIRKQHLYFNGTELQDEKTLPDYFITSNTTIHMLIQLSKYLTVPIYVKTLTKQTHVLHVNLGQTVYRLKKFIEDRIDIPINEQRLTFNGNQLEDDHILYDYHIGKESTVSISLRLSGGHDLLPTFADVSTAQVETLRLVQYAPKGCVVTAGTNIELKCEYTHYNVYSMQGFGIYELGKDKVTCPNCYSTDPTGRTSSRIGSKSKKPINISVMTRPDKLDGDGWELSRNHSSGTQLQFALSVWKTFWDASRRCPVVIDSTKSALQPGSYIVQIAELVVLKEF